MPERIGRVVVRNTSGSLRLVKTFAHLCHGDWTPGGWQPPAFIEPGATGGMQSESGGVLTGTEGYAKYDVVDLAGRRHGMIYLYWDNPWVGVTHPRFATNAGDVFPDCDFDAPTDSSVFQVDTSLSFHLAPVAYRHTHGGGDVTSPGDLAAAFLAGPVGGIALLFGLKGIVKDPVWEYELRDGLPTFHPPVAVIGAIRDKWLALQARGVRIGEALDVEKPTFDGAGRAQEFRGGTISWRSEHGAFAAWGLIRARWVEIGRERFGYPITDETGTPDGIGRFNHFRAVHLPGHPEASIYWTPGTGAHEIFGAIRAKWASLGWEKSSLGYPVGPETDRSDGRPGREQRFQHGRLIWSAAGGAVLA
jgi:LGFP repeat